MLARHLSGEPDTGSLMAALAMSSWIINKHNEACRKDEDEEEEQQENPTKKRKPKKPPAPPDHRLNPFDLGRREANPIGDQCYLTAPEYGLDMHETWDPGFVALCNMAGLTPLQAAQLFVQRPAPSFVQIRDPWLPAKNGTRTTPGNQLGTACLATNAEASTTFSTSSASARR